MRKCGIVCFPLLVTTVFCFTNRFHLCSLGKEQMYTPTTQVYSGELVALDLFVKRPDIVHDIMGKSVSRFALL